MSISLSPSTGTILSLSSSTIIKLTTDSNVSTHNNGTSGIFYWFFYDSNGNALGGSGGVGSDGYGAKTATYTATPSNYIVNGVYPAYLEVSGWFVTNYGSDPEMGTSYRWEIEAPPISFGDPTPPTIKQNDDGTFTVSWSAVSASGGSGNVEYRLWDATNGGVLCDYTTATSVKLDIPSYGVYLEYRIEARYSGTSKNSTRTGKTFAAPTLSIPSGVGLSSTAGDTTTISWKASSLANTSLVSGTAITYLILKNKTQIASTTNTSFPFDKSVTSAWGTDAVSLTVVATAQTINKHYPTQRTIESSAVSFTYQSSGTVMYYTGNSPVECIVHYYTESGWVECIPHYYTSNGWVECSH